MTCQKLDNTCPAAKIALRNHYLNLRPPKRILECYGGERREMYHACYEGYDVTAVDIKKLPNVITVDNRQYLRNHADEYDFFDLDAYGSPDEQLVTLFASRTSPDPFTVVVTDGSKIKLKYEYVSHINTVTARIPIKMHIPGLFRFQDELIWYILLAASRRYSIRISDAKIVRRVLKDRRYYGFVAQKYVTES